MRLADNDVRLVVRAIEDLARQSTFEVNAYWLAVPGNREEYRARLASQLDLPGTPVLIVKGRFDNANSIMDDLAGILEQNRAAVLAAFQHGTADTERISIVLLAHNELEVPEISSPVVWPHWVPRIGNTVAPCALTDVTRRINVPLNEDAVDVGRLNHGLYTVEDALIRRLTVVTQQVPEAHRDLFDVIARPKDVAWAGFLAKVKLAHADVPSWEKYRPNVQDGDSVVARLWQVVQTRCAKDVDRTVAALIDALHIVSLEALEGWQQSLFGMLARGTLRHQSEPEKFARGMLFTVAASCQYITCAAHADQYQQLPLNLVTSVVDDLQAGLANIESCLKGMPKKDLRRTNA
jgi:hypothetical protein